MGGPCRGSSKKVFGRPHVEAVQRKCLGGLAKLRRLRDTLPAALKKSIYNALVLPHLDYCCMCTLARMRNPTSKKSGENTKLCSEAYFSKPPRTPSEELKGDMNCIYVPIKKAGVVQLGTSAPVCAWACTRLYLAECYETNKQYGHCIARGVNELLKVSEHRVWQ